jgi:tetratricopeptide (TPR) repeat protein
MHPHFIGDAFFLCQIHKKMNFFATMIKQISLIFLLMLAMASCQPKKEENAKSALPKDSTLELLNARINGDPKNHALYAKRAELWLNKGKSQLAYDDIATAVRLDSMSYDYQFRFSEISFLVGKSRQTKQALEKCLQLKPDDANARLKLAELYIYVKEYKKALALLKEVTDVDKLNAKAYFLKGLSFKLAGDTNLAISNYQRSVELDQEYYHAYMQLGVLFGAKHNPVALDYYNNALNLNPQSTEAMYAKSLFYQDHGDIKSAIAGYNMLLQIDTANYFTYYNLGYISYNVDKDYRKATVMFSRALNFNPAYAEAYYMRGLSFEQLGEFAKSIRDYTEAIKIAPGYELDVVGLDRVERK